jgi:hypothetical protein
LLVAIAFGASATDASVYTVGELTPVAGDDIFSASWLHDASGAQIVGDQPSDNGAYRSGKTSGGITGSLFGDLVDGKLTGIGGTLTGNLSHLLKKIDANLKNQAFTLQLGESIDASHTGALMFQTNGAGPGEFTGGFIDYLLEVPGVPTFSLAGTFFFKPQAETGSTALSPNRGDGSAFTLWGYNWMHDSAPIAGDPPAADWLSFLGELGYEGTSQVTRPEIVDGGQTLGIALFATANQPVQTSHNPEPTALLVWGGLAMLAIGTGRSTRQSS